MHVSHDIGPMRLLKTFHGNSLKAKMLSIAESMKNPLLFLSLCRPFYWKLVGRAPWCRWLSSLYSGSVSARSWFSTYWEGASKSIDIIKKNFLKQLKTFYTIKVNISFTRSSTAFSSYSRHDIYQVSTVAHLIMYISSAVNPMIYNFFSGKFTTCLPCFTKHFAQF